MVYFIRTKYGDSTSSYGGRQVVPFQGSCQGNGASPALWLVISMYLVLLMKDNGHCSNLQTAYSGLCFVLMGFLFVDDTDLVVIGEDTESEEDVHRKLQHAVNFWNGTLRASGGALRPEKCYWYSLNFQWKDGISQLSTITPPPIFVTKDDGTLAPIKHMNPNDSTEAVGVWQDASGTSNKQITTLIEKVRRAHKTLQTLSLIHI